MIKALEGKTALVTGGNSGIGKPTALALAERGADVTIIGRNRETCEEAVREIKAAAGHDDVRYYLVDLASMESIREFAEQFKEDKDRLDILVNNAGVICPSFRTTKEGVDATMGINYLGHFYLTILLADILVASKARLVVVASSAHAWGDIKLDQLEGNPLPTLFQPLPEGTSQNTQTEKYNECNRARIYFTKEFSKRYPAVTAVSLHPGFVNTDIVRDFTGCWGGIWGRMFKLGKTPAQGAATSIYCATEASVESGQYYSSCRVKPLKKEWILDDIQERLWEVSEKFCKDF